MKAQLFIPCFIDQLSPNVGRNVYELLTKAGCDVVYPSQQTCCGQAGYNAGHKKEGLCVSKGFFKQFSTELPTVVPSASCAAYVRQIYGELYDTTSQTAHYNGVSYFPIYELSDFLCNVLKEKNFSHVSFPHKVAFHTSCASLREYDSNANESAIELLKSVQGIELVDMPSSEECCGFGGSFSVSYNAISGAMAQRKVEAASDAASYITSLDMSCLLHLEKFVKGELTAVHVADILHGNMG